MMWAMPISRAGQVVHERAAARRHRPSYMSQLLTGPALQQHQPRIGAHQQRGPEGQHHRDHAERGGARRQLREQIGKRIAEHEADGSGDEADLERRPEDRAVGAAVDHAGDSAPWRARRRRRRTRARRASRWGCRMTPAIRSSSAGAQSAASSPAFAPLRRGEAAGVAEIGQGDRRAEPARSCDPLASSRRSADPAATTMVSLALRPSAIGDRRRRYAIDRAATARFRTAAERMPALEHRRSSRKLSP